MAIQTRNSALAIKKETVEGTPENPSVSTDFIALQDDLSITPSFATLENAEKRSSLGSAKPIQGIEEPSLTMSHYLRSSGVEGQKPNYGPLLEAAYGLVNTTSQRLVVDSSTTIVTTLTGLLGETVFQGQAFIILDGSNGYSIRHVSSIVGNDITWDFPLSSAPANGVELSQVTTYYPSQQNQPTLSMWHYVGNGGAIELMAGGRTTSVSTTIDAGELINTSYTVEGTSYSFNVVEIDASTKFLDFTDDDGTFAISVAEGFYKDPNDLASALESALNSSPSTQNYTVEYLDRGSDIGKYIITNTTGVTLDLLFLSGANTANSIAAKIGFDVVDETGATSYTSDSKIVLSSSISPTFDNSDPLAAKNNELFIAKQGEEAICVDASNFTLDTSLTKVNVESICEESGVKESVFNERVVTGTVTLLLEAGEAEFFHRFHENDDVIISYHFGTKSGGNWNIGRSGSLHVPQAVLTDFSLADEDGLAVVNLSFQAIVNQNGDPEVFQNFL